MNMPSPKLFTNLPEESNLRMVGRFEPAHVFAPHRSATHMDLPSGSISTALVAPHVLPAGIFAQFSTVRYGLGRSLTGWAPLCVDALPANIAMAATNTKLIRTKNDIGRPP